jgi:carboxypeptidase Taq
MAIHESQSLLIEMQVCRSRAFLTYLSPHLAAAFGERACFQADNLYRDAIWVEPGFIRVDADEVTYPLHVILRYRLEQALLSGELPVADLPLAWSQGMTELLGIEPPDDAQGCLQDIHWPGGAIGYFPCYTLGAITAAQLFDSAAEAMPDLTDEIARGDFKGLLAWLRTEIHGEGARLHMQSLLTKATGRGLSLEPYLAHLTRRYA